MSEIDYCPRGGMVGILVSVTEQKSYAKENKLKYIDQIIPLPDGNSSHKDSCNNHLSYWENNQGSHGWCCNICGKVLQWG